MIAAALLVLALVMIARDAGLLHLPMWPFALVLAGVVEALSVRNRRKAADTDGHVERELYRLILEQSNDILLDWDFQTDRLSVSERWQERFGYPALTEEFSRRIFLSPHLYPADLPVVKDYLTRLKKGDLPSEPLEIRLSTAAKRFIWVQLKAGILRDAKGKPVRAVGALRDIDKEHRELERLRSSASSDPLTGVYNKAASRRLAEEHLETATPADLCALFILDVDNFKQINDTMGHPFGDKVLCEVSGKLQSLFRDSDIVGRAGGDEFTVFLKNVPSHQLVEDKGKALVRMFREQFADYRGPGLGISCSIGAALFPCHGTTYEELYQKADQTLYLVKNAGKNHFCLYHSEQSCLSAPTQ